MAHEAARLDEMIDWENTASVQYMRNLVNRLLVARTITKGQHEAMEAYIDDRINRRGETQQKIAQSAGVSSTTLQTALNKILTALEKDPQAPVRQVPASGQRLLRPLEKILKEIEEERARKRRPQGGGRGGP